MKKILNKILVFMIISSLGLSSLISFSEILPETPTIENVELIVKGELITITGFTKGETDGMNINIKILNEEGKSVHFDQLEITGNKFESSFIPMIEKDKKYVMKISGDLLFSREFIYNENTNPPKTYPNKLLDETNTLLKTSYSYYQDKNVKIDYTYELVDNKDYILIKALMPKVISTDNIWNTKDNTRYDLFLTTIGTKAFNIIKKPIKIYVFDKNKKKILEKTVDLKDSTKNATVEAIKNTLNTTFSKYNEPKFTYFFTYTVKETTNPDLLTVSMKGTNFVFDDNNWKSHSENMFTTFLESINIKINGMNNKNLKIQLYDKNNKFVTSYDYYREVETEENPNEYKPYEEPQLTEGEQIFKLLKYTKNSSKIEETEYSKKLDNGFLVGEFSDSTVLNKKLSNLSNTSTKEIILELKGTENKNFKLSSNIVTILKENKIALTLSSEQGIVYINPTSIIPQSIDLKISKNKNNVKFDLNGLKNVKVSIPYGTSTSTSSVKNIQSLTVYKVEGDKSSIVLNGINRDIKSVNFKLSDSGEFYVVNNSKNYTDLSQTFWAVNQIEYVTSKELMSGKSNTIFSQKEVISRATFISMANKKLGLKDSTNNTLKLSKSWFNSKVNSAYSAKILPPSYNGKTDYRKPITREEAVYILMAMYDKNPENKKITPSAVFYSDRKSISSWAVSGLSKASELGIVKGNDKNNFNPKGSLTRAEEAVLLYNLLSVEGYTK